jgi:hypothetical protein
MAYSKAVPKVMMGQDVDLPFPEDPGLNFASPEAPQIRRPAGVTSLRQWGAERFPEGKYTGKTFKEVFDEDTRYCAFMKNHTQLTNAWALNFQNYVRAMHQSKLQMPLQPMTKGMSSAKAPGAPGLTTPHWTPSQEIEHEMMMVRDEEKEQLLMAKIAILQRELDQMRKNSNS